MKLMSIVNEGEVRIDFNPNLIANDKLQEIYDYFQSMSTSSKIVWANHPRLLKRGVVKGCYNRFITTDEMAKLACKKAENFIKERSESSD